MTTSLPEHSTSIVERLRKTKPVTQYDSAGRLIAFDGTPTPLEEDAAAEIERLSKELADARATAVGACLARIAAFKWPHQMDNGPYARGFFDGQNSTVKCVVDDLRTLTSKATP